jgi:hypothetical protein
MPEDDEAACGRARRSSSSRVHRWHRRPGYRTTGPEKTVQKLGVVTSPNKMDAGVNSEVVYVKVRNATWALSVFPSTIGYL